MATSTGVRNLSGFFSPFTGLTLSELNPFGKNEVGRSQIEEGRARFSERADHQRRAASLLQVSKGFYHELTRRMDSTIF